MAQMNAQIRGQGEMIDELRNIAGLLEDQGTAEDIGRSVRDGLEESSI